MFLQVTKENVIQMGTNGRNIKVQMYSNIYNIIYIIQWV